MSRMSREFLIGSSWWRLLDICVGGPWEITVPMSCGGGGGSGSYLVPCIGVGGCQCPNLVVECRDFRVNV